MNLDDCLPPSLRGPDTKITRIAAGMSGAGVYKVDAGGASYVLKVGGDASAELLRRVEGVGPHVVHVDEARRAVVSELVVDRGLMPRLMTPATRTRTLQSLGTALRAVHDTPLPDGLAARDIGAILHLADGVPKPGFVADAIAGMLAEPPPPIERPVLSHNDVNPTNVVLDGEDRIRLLDWDAAGPNDARFDLATVSLFLRLAGDDLAALLAAHGDVVADDRFHYYRRLCATACCSAFLHIARGKGHVGFEGQTRDGVLSLAEVYARMRAGELSVATGEGQFAIGVALVKEL